MFNFFWENLLNVGPFTLILTLISTILLWFAISYSEILLSENQKKINRISEEMEKIYEVDQWIQKARQIDELSGANSWKEIRESDLYDFELVENRTLELKALVREKNYLELRNVLRSGLERNFGGIMNRRLYKVAILGTKIIIENYLKEVENALNFLSDAPESEFPLKEKFSFFMEVRQRFGRTAVLFSGGAAFGMFHVGVARMFSLMNLNPRVVCGSSAGAIIAGGYSSKVEEEMARFDIIENYQLKAFSKGIPNEFFENMKRLITGGYFLDVEHLVKCMRDNLEDLTFQEVYEKTGRMLNVTIGATTPHEMPRLLNYLTAPDVVIWPAVAASCAFPGLFEPIPLIQRRRNGEHVAFHEPASKWRDGSLEHDLPMNRLSEMFNVNFHVVSQVNPHVVPIHLLMQNRFLRVVLGLIGSEIRHRILQLSFLGFVPKILVRALLQDYTGDITIVPRPAWWQFFYVVSNPSTEFMKESMTRGRHAWLRKLTHFENGFKTENLLEEKVDELCRKLNLPTVKEAAKTYKSTESSQFELKNQSSSLSLDRIASLHLSSVHLPSLLSND